MKPRNGRSAQLQNVGGDSLPAGEERNTTETLLRRRLRTLPDVASNLNSIHRQLCDLGRVSHSTSLTFSVFLRESQE